MSFRYHGRTANVQPRRAYEALIKIGRLVDESDTDYADVELGQIFKAIKDGADAALDDELRERLQQSRVFRELVEQYEQSHVYFLVDRGLVLDHGKDDGQRRLELSNRGRSVVDYDERGEIGKARRLYIESMEDTTANTFRHRAVTKNKSGQGVRPLRHLARTFIESDRDTIERYEADEALFESKAPDEVAGHLDEVVPPDERAGEKQVGDDSDDGEGDGDSDDDEDGDGDEEHRDDVQALFREAENHPAFYREGAEQSGRLKVRDRTALKQLADLSPALNVGTYRGLDREVGRLIQGQPGLRLSDLQSLDGMGETYERQFYETLAEKCRMIDEPTPEVRRQATQQALSAALDELPASVDTSAIRSMIHGRDENYDERYKGEVRAMRSAVEGVFRTVEDPEAIRSVVGAVVDENNETLRANMEYLCSGGEPVSVPDGKQAYEDCLSCHDFSRRLHYERVRQGVADEEIAGNLRALNQLYNSDQPVQSGLSEQSTKLPTDFSQNPALKLEDYFGLSLVAMANQDQSVKRNLNTQLTPYGEHGIAYAEGGGADTSYRVAPMFHALGEVTGINTDHDQIQREYEQILRHGEEYAQKRPLIQPDQLPILFVAPAGLGTDSSMASILKNAYTSPDENYETNPVPIELGPYVDLFESVQNNDRTLREFDDLLRRLARTFELYSEYDHTTRKWVEEVREPMIEQFVEGGELPRNEDWSVDLPVATHQREDNPFYELSGGQIDRMSHENALEHYREELSADLGFYEQQYDNPRAVLEALVRDTLSTELIEQFGESVRISAPGYRYFLEEHHELIEKRLRTMDRITDEQKIKHVLPMVETILEHSDRDDLLGEETDWGIELQALRDRLLDLKQSEASLEGEERELLDALYEEAGEDFGKWYANLNSPAQRRAALSIALSDQGSEPLRTFVETEAYDGIERKLQSDEIWTYADRKVSPPLSFLRNKWEEAMYWHDNFPDVFEEHIHPLIDEGLDYDQFLQTMTTVLQKRLQEDLQQAVKEFADQEDPETVYEQLKERFEQQQLQTFVRQAEVILGRTVGFDSKPDRDFSDRLQTLVDFIVEETDEPFDFESVDRRRLGQYYESLREELERTEQNEQTN